jgi:Lrp/AsnC family transcriptional regulator for asnA, asnC and gidA
VNDLDARITRLLEAGGYRSNKALAGDLGVAERTVRRHVNGMVAKGALSVVLIPNPVACGMRAWTKIGVKTEPAFMRSVAEWLVRHRSVYFVANSLGRFDIIIAAHFDSVAKLEHFVNSELASLPGVTSSETWMLASPRKYYGFSWPAPLIGGNHNLRPEWSAFASSVDQGIVSALWEDGRARVDSISTALGVSQATVRRRLYYMLSNDLCKREIVLSPSVLGTETWATIGISTRSRDVHEVIDELLKYPAVYLASSSLGKFNIVLGTRFRSIDLLNRFVMVDLPTTDGITSTETFVHNKPLKYHNIVMNPLE